jgi:hypothetical protein
MADDFVVDYASLHEETYVGGIYLRIFLQNPQYNLRKPEKFVEALLQAHEQLARQEGMAKELSTICTCILTILKVRAPAARARLVRQSCGRVPQECRNSLIPIRNWTAWCKCLNSK